MATATKGGLAGEIRTAAAEYEAAYAAFERATKMNVPTPEGCGTFGGVWDCDQGRLLRTLARAVRRVHGTCSAAVEKAVASDAVTVVQWQYDLAGAPAADLYQMANGLLRDPDGRYLTGTEQSVLVCVLGDFQRFDYYDTLKAGRATRMVPTSAEPGSDRAHYHAPGRIMQRLIDELAGDQVARTLTGSYLTGWPVCTEREKLDAYRRVGGIYRGLAADFAACA